VSRKTGRPIAGMLCWEAGEVLRGLEQLAELPGDAADLANFPFLIRYKGIERACLATIAGIEHASQRKLIHDNQENPLDLPLFVRELLKVVGESICCDRDLGAIVHECTNLHPGDQAAQRAPDIRYHFPRDHDLCRFEPATGTAPTW